MSYDMDVPLVVSSGVLSFVCLLALASASPLPVPVNKGIVSVRLAPGVDATGEKLKT